MASNEDEVQDLQNQLLVQQAWKEEFEKELEWEQNVSLNGNDQEESLASPPPAQQQTNQRKVVIIGGSGLLQSTLFSSLKKLTSQEGVEYFHSIENDFVYISRHSATSTYAQPHQIEHLKIWNLIKEIQPTCVLGICSVGSLHPSIVPMGSILLPQDWLHSTFTPSYFHNDANAHVRPYLDESYRKVVLDSLNTKELAPYLVNMEDLVYCQTRGPRFETKAEIRMIRTFAHVVGMTAGDEASLACELGIPYVMLCFVDNLAHGLSKTSDKAIENIESFRKAQKANLDRVEKAVDVALKSLLGRNTSMPLVPSIPENAIDLLIKARYIATVDMGNTVHSYGVVAVRNGEIVGVHSANDQIPMYAAKEIVDLPDSLLIPGLINAHTHSAMTLMRGFGDDLKLTDW
jgi:5'-methylthioadenosine phosphorylase